MALPLPLILPATRGWRCATMRSLDSYYNYYGPAPACHARLEVRHQPRSRSRSSSWLGLGSGSVLGLGLGLGLGYGLLTRAAFGDGQLCVCPPDDHYGRPQLRPVGLDLAPAPSPAWRASARRPPRRAAPGLGWGLGMGVQIRVELHLAWDGGLGQ
eukprot:scaffold49525_cov32-Phaeocystis_antarctica.AAC.1